MPDVPIVTGLADEPAPRPAEPPSLLRFITCGSVDDGKSTLIGRLLHDSGSIPDDQLERLSADSRRWGTQGGALDYALLLDGLSAEREQGITIDVAYRYFATPRRSFIVADTPGHRQYTRNMATGASTADLAVLLVDAQKGLLTQTRRHTLIASLLGVRHLVLAVNKMDLAGYNQAAFVNITEDFKAFAARLGFASIMCIPLAAKRGENVVASASTMPWYSGPTLLAHLEQIDVTPPAAAQALRLPVQLVSRPTPHFRGYAGTVAAGTLRTGMRVCIQPGTTTAGIARIVTADGDLAEAAAGEAITVVLDEDIDVSRGDTIADAQSPAVVTDTLETSLLWVSEAPLNPGTPYLLKAGAATVSAQVDAPRHGIDVETGGVVVMTSLAMNEVGQVTVRLDRKLPFDTYAQSRATGGFILIDRLSHETVAIGLVDTPVVAAAPAAAQSGERWPPLTGESSWRSLAKALSWRAVGSLGTVVLAFAVTHDKGLAAAIGGGEILTKIVTFYLHERVWARVPFGLARSSRSVP
jgi:sulfate adenylyltransferase large subunit